MQKPRWAGQSEGCSFTVVGRTGIMIRYSSVIIKVIRAGSKCALRSRRDGISLRIFSVNPVQRVLFRERQELRREPKVIEKRSEGLKRQLEKLRAEKRAFREKIAGLKKEHRETVRRLKEGWRLLDALPGAVVLIQNEKIRYANDAAREALGCHETEVVGRNFADFVLPEFQERLLERHRKRLSGKTVPNRYEACLRNRRGGLLWCEVRVKKILVGGRRAFLLNLYGLNARKEDEQRRVEEEKQQMVTRLSKGMYAELIAWQALFTRNVAGSVSAERGDARQMSPHGQETFPLLRELAWLGESEKALKKPTPFDLRKVAQEVLSDARARWCKTSGEEAGITIKSYLRALPTLEGRPEEVTFALSALVKNAVEALEGTGHIYVTAEESGGFAYLYIQDSGGGIPREIEDRMYDPFITTKGKGRRGLGLTLARTLLKRNGGDMELHSSDGGGTVCTIRMPVPSVRSLKQESPKRGGLKDALVLVVSTQDILRDLLCRWFSGKGCQVDARVSCGEAFQLIKKKAYDLVVLDTERQERKALLSFLQKTHRIRPVTSVVVVENPVSPRSLRLAKDFSRCTFIEKPLNMDTAHAVFAEALGPKGAV
jgi:PAS domain S-box-containing protein